MKWTHPSLEGRPPEYTIRNGIVMKGATMIAWTKLVGKNLMVYRDGDLIGIADCNAAAMLMAIRFDDEMKAGGAEASSRFPTTRPAAPYPANARRALPRQAGT